MIELFFRQSKSKLALDKYQIRSQQGIQRYWLIMSLAYYLCLQEQIKQEQVGNLHQFITNGASLEEVLELVG